MVVISYDIADDKLRRHFSKYLEKFGHDFNTLFSKLITANIFWIILSFKLKINLQNAFRRQIVS